MISTKHIRYAEALLLLSRAGAEPVEAERALLPHVFRCRGDRVVQRRQLDLALSQLAARQDGGHVA